jgi:hypothetical protein
MSKTLDFDKFMDEILIKERRKNGVPQKPQEDTPQVKRMKMNNSSFGAKVKFTK